MVGVENFIEWVYFVGLEDRGDRDSILNDLVCSRI